MTTSDQLANSGETLEKHKKRKIHADFCRVFSRFIDLVAKRKDQIKISLKN